MGVKIENGKIVSVKPNLYELKNISAEIPLGNEIAKIKIDENDISVEYINL